MALPKLYDLITWHNNTTPALNEDNLNAMSQAIDDIDDRVIDLAGTIMEDVPQIQEDMEILGPAVENIDNNVARAEAAADSAEQYAEEIAPPIEVVKDYAPIITIEDAINKAAKDVKVKVDAVQDLHGYTKPWVGGAGKNKLPLRLSDLKSINTTGAWSNNVYTLNNVTYTVKTDSSGNVTEIVANNTANANGSFYLCNSFALDGEYIMSVQQAIPANVYFSLRGAATKDVSPTQTSASFSASGTCNSYIFVSNGVSFSNYSIKPMIRLSSVADGSFEPYANICPITGHSEAKVTRNGFNQWDEVSKLGTYSTADGAFAVDSTHLASNGYIKVYPNTDYYYNTNGYNINVCYYDKYKNFIGNFNSVHDVVRTTPNNCAYIAFNMALAYGVTYNHDICINISNTAKNGEYEPSKVDVYTIDLDGTRYGGVLDVDAGTLTLTKGYADLGDLTWEYITTTTLISVPVFLSNNINDKKGGSNNMISSHYYVSGIDRGALVTHDKSMAPWNSVNSQAITIRDSSYTDAATFKTAMNGAQLVYELATPQTIQLTAEEVQLLWAYNTLWADTGDIALTYDASGVLRIANAKLDIDTFKSIVAASSDFADFKSRVAAL